MRRLTFKYQSDNIRSDVNNVLDLYKLWHEVISLSRTDLAETMFMHIIRIDDKEEADKRILDVTALLKLSSNDIQTIDTLITAIENSDSLEFIEEEVSDITVVMYNALFPSGNFYENGKLIKKERLPAINKIKVAEKEDYKYKYEIVTIRDYNILTKVKTAIKLLNYLFKGYLNEELKVNIREKKNNVILTLCTNNALINESIDEKEKLLTFIMSYSYLNNYGGKN